MLEVEFASESMWVKPIWDQRTVLHKSKQSNTC